MQVRGPWGVAVLMLVAGAVVATGCARHRGALEPSAVGPDTAPALPAAGAARLEPAPVEPRTTADLLRDANEAFQDANKAQEQGDHEAALRHYTLMLELLIEADPDPAVFYSLRTEFNRILESASDQMQVARRPTPPERVSVTFPVVQFGDLPVPMPPPERVIKQVEKIQKVYSANFLRGLNRSGKYRAQVEAKLAKAGLPKDLVWLAMVESQFHPRAKSRAGAAGMWQFMPATGRRYGLRVDSDMDERYNWEKATDAAIAYLTDLRDMFDGNLPLAVSAYNCGENRIDKLLAGSSGETDLWRILETRAADRHLRLETKEFYAKLCASVLVARKPGQYGLEPAFEKPDNTVRITVKGPYALEDLDRACGLAAGTLKTLNPDLFRGATPLSGTHQLAVPTAYRGKFQTALNTVPRLKPGVHIVKRGETPSHIASLHRVSKNELMRLNKIKNPRRLQIGQRLLIPGVLTKTSSGRTTSAPVTASSDGRKVYTVRKGDTLSGIAQSQHATVANLKKWNSLKRSRIHIGDRLFVSSPASPTPSAPSGDGKIHIVRKGEFPGLIAQAYSVPLDDLLRWNNLTKKSTIRPGQRLAVYEPVAKPAAPEPPKEVTPEAPAPEKTVDVSPAEPSPPAGPTVTHVVANGESPWTIARKYGVKTADVLAWNNLTKKSVLHVGDKLVIAVPESQPAPVQAAASPPPEPAPSEPAEEAAPPNTTRRIHKVANAENPWVIAKKYNVRVADLLAWNGLSKKSVLHVGDELVVHVPNQTP